ncbi:MAG TPA: class IV adenylate cyclase [Mycobacterium sp.]|jgi:adenylate cyclase class 2|nr:class IV adenylate cyclase [Mycobacterium sp.]
MPIEHEAKILDIDLEAFARKVHDKGGYQVGRERLMRRYVYDIARDDPSRWIRLRDDGGNATLTVKHIYHDGIDGTHEIEVEVSDFEGTNTMLTMMGFRAKAYQENRRTSYILDGAHIEVDRWPGIPPYAEIEASTKAEVIRVAELLGYSEADLTGENTVKVYRRYGIELEGVPELQF